MIARLAHWLVRYRYILALAWTITVITIASLGLPRITSSSDYRTFIDQDNPELVELERFEDKFEILDNLVILVEAENSIFSQGAADALVGMTRALGKSPGVVQVRSIANESMVRAMDDKVRVTSLDEILREGDREAAITRARNYFARFPEYNGVLYNEEKTAAAIFAGLDYEHANSFAGQEETLTAVRNILSEYEGQGLHFAIGGDPAGKYHAQKVLKRDLGVRMPIILALMFIATYLALRSLRLALIVYPVVIASAVGTLAITPMLDITLNNINGLAPLIVIILSTADGIHVQSHFQRNSRKGIGPASQANQAALETTLKPMFLTTVSTAAGFLSLFTASSNTINNLGLLAALGIVIAFLSTIFLMPALNTLAFRRTGASNAPARAITERFVDACQAAVRGYRTLIIGIAVIALAISAVGLPQLRFDDSLVEYFRKDHVFRQDSERIQEELSTAGVTLILDARDGITEPAFIDEAEQLLDWLRRQPEISGATSVITEVAEMDRVMRNHVAERQFPPEDRDLMAQLFLVNELSGKSGIEIANEYSSDKSQLVVNVYLNDLSRQQMNAFSDQVEQRSAHYPTMEIHGPTGMKVVFDENIMTWTQELFVGSAIALLVICVIISLAFLSVESFAIALASSVVPAGLVFGMIGLTGTEITFFGSIIACVALGVIADDTIHLLTHIRANRDRFASMEEAAEVTLGQVGPAIFTTTFSLVLGLAPVLTTAFVPTLTMAIILIPLVLVAMLWDLLVVPSLLVTLFDRMGQRSYVS